MSEDIVAIIAKYGLETIAIAVIVNILTAIIKMPIKHFAKKTKNSEKITRFIVILPILIGFAITTCYTKFVLGNIMFDKAFITLWLTSSSLSLTIYAVLEKMLPSKKSIADKAENEMTERIIAKMQTLADGIYNKAADTEQENEGDADHQSANNDEQATVIEQAAECRQYIVQEQIHPDNKIVLRGNANVQTDTQE